MSNNFIFNAAGCLKTIKPACASLPPDLPWTFIKFYWESVDDSRIHAAGSANLLWSPDDLFTDADDGEKLTTVRVVLGAHFSAPDFVIDFAMKAPSEMDVVFYRSRVWQVRLNPNSATAELIIDRLASSELFARLFAACTGAAIEITGKNGVTKTRPVSRKLKNVFVEAIPAQWQTVIIEILLRAEFGTLECCNSEIEI